MAESFFNKEIENIKYASSPDKRAVVTFSGQGTGNTSMLISGATLTMGRPATLQRFLNADAALMVGRSSGSLQLTGLFGTTDQIKNVLGTPGNPCKLPRTIKLSAGVLKTCSSGTGGSASEDETIILYGCVCQGFEVSVAINSQDGSVVQTASATFSVVDAGA